jgi:hypothetical protein
VCMRVKESWAVSTGSSVKFKFMVRTCKQLNCPQFNPLAFSDVKNLSFQGLEGGWRKHYNFRCEPVDYTSNPRAIRVIYNHSNCCSLTHSRHFVINLNDHGDDDEVVVA